MHRWWWSVCVCTRLSYENSSRSVAWMTLSNTSTLPWCVDRNTITSWYLDLSWNNTSSTCKPAARWMNQERQYVCAWVGGGCWGSEVVKKEKIVITLTRPHFIFLHEPPVFNQRIIHLCHCVLKKRKKSETTISTWLALKKNAREKESLHTWPQMCLFESANDVDDTGDGVWHRQPLIIPPNHCLYGRSCWNITPIYTFILVENNIILIVTSLQDF